MFSILISDLMKDLGRFAVILALFHTAFTMSLCAVYNATFVKPETAGHTPREVSVLLFFALFGLTEPKEMPTLVGSPPAAGVVAQLAFGIYLVVTVIVLINLLIAMMSDTYQRIQARSDTEWKFGRAVLIRDMSRKSGTPSPFNLFTNLFFFAKVLCKHGGEFHTSVPTLFREFTDSISAVLTTTNYCFPRRQTMSVMLHHVLYIH